MGSFKIEVGSADGGVEVAGVADEATGMGCIWVLGKG